MHMYTLRRFACRGVLVAGALALAMPLSEAQADSVESHSCMSSSGSDARLTATYTAANVGGRESKEFNADLEVARGQYKKGRKVKILVNDVKVARRPLERGKNGDLEVDVKLTTEKKRGKKAWPDNFPKVDIGTVVEARVGKKPVLRCVLF